MERNNVNSGSLTSSLLAEAAAAAESLLSDSAATAQSNLTLGVSEHTAVEEKSNSEAMAMGLATAAPTAAAAAMTSKTAPASVTAGGIGLTNKMPEILELPLVADYLDFRKYLLDYYRYRRELSKNDIRPYSYAVFSAAANIKSPNYLKLIIEGRRNLSVDMISKFAKALGLNKDQADEFRLMVLFGQATDPAERLHHLRALNDKRVESKLKSGEIDQKTWEKIPSWITWVMYSLLDQEKVTFEAEKLRETLRNKASIDEISAAMKSLLKSGEIVKDEATGEFKKARSLMESAEDVPVALVRKLQAELMYLGMESLFHDGPTEREFGSATLSLTKTEFEELRFQLRKIRKEAQKKIGVKRLSSKGERVYQLNLQLFPVSNKSE